MSPHTEPIESARDVHAGGETRDARRLSRDEQGRIVLHREDDEPLAGVRVARCFPWSLPDRYFSVRDPDGQEVWLIKTIDELGDESRAVIEQELTAQEFLPNITKVNSVVERFDVTAWDVETDRGPIELRIKHSEDVRMLESGRVVIRDHAGGLFAVPDLSQLDEKSQRLIEDHLT